MEGTRKWKKASFSTIVWAVLGVVLCAAPPVQADVTVLPGDPCDIDYDVGGFLYVYGTANLDTGAYAAYGIEAHPGSTVNIWGGNIGAGFRVTVFGATTEPPASAAAVTVYGTGFEDDLGPVPYGEWTPDGGSETLIGTYGNGDSISLWFISSVPILLTEPGTTNLPPVAIAGQEGLIGAGGKIHPIYSSEQDTTIVLGQASDPEEEPIEYRWLEGTEVLLDWTSVTTPPEAYLYLSTVAPFSLGDHTLTLEVREVDGDMLEFSDDMTLRILGSLIIDIKPNSYPNNINLGSHGVVPVAILSINEPYFDATLISPDTVFLAGSGVRVRGKGNKYLASEEDVDGDGLLDLVVKVETENLDPGTFQNGGAFLQIRETSDPESPIIDEGWDEITIVPPE